ncbi:MAG: hypothetical protein K6B13_11480 [Prevotella sp.]|nr:hypothetical protein [Prevotella sp.]
MKKSHMRFFHAELVYENKRGVQQNKRGVQQNKFRQRVKDDVYSFYLSEDDSDAYLETQADDQLEQLVEQEELMNSEKFTDYEADDEVEPEDEMAESTTAVGAHDFDPETRAKSPYDKYKGKWSAYMTDENGARIKFLTIAINDDLSADHYLYLPDGNTNHSHWEKCVFANGYVYFTINGTYSDGHTPKAAIDNNGLLDGDGNPLLKE